MVMKEWESASCLLQERAALALRCIHGPRAAVAVTLALCVSVPPTKHGNPTAMTNKRCKATY